MKRQQVILIGSTMVLSWLLMQAVHESGHVIAAIASGGKIKKVVLHPAAISYTHVTVNPHPLFVAWMGPIVGIALPIAALVPARWFKMRGWYVLQFFAGFCLVANGAYLSLGSFGHVGDVGDLLRRGVPIMLLLLFGVITIPTGLWLWNGLGPHFGLGDARGHVDHMVAYVVPALVVVTVFIELVIA
jgi:hypothetical protein